MPRTTIATEQSVLTLDYRSMALFRVAVGLVILFDLACRSFDIPAFYTDDGLLPRAALTAERWYDRYTSIYMLSGEASGIRALFVMAGLAAVALTLGYKTRLATIVSFLFLLSLHNRNGMILQGGDHFLRLLCFWSIFLPLGAKYSIDSRRQPPPSGDSFTSVVTLGVLLQIAFVYVFSAVQKLVDPLWQNGTVITQALLLDDFAKPFGIRLLGADALLRATAWLTLVIETMLPFLLFLPWRTGLIRMLTVFIYWLMHLGIHVVLYVGFFTPVTLMAWTIVLPGCFWNGLRSWLRPGTAPRSAAIESAPELPRQADRAIASRLAAPVVLALLVVVFVENLGHTPGANFSYPGRFGTLLNRGGLAQNWSMFTALDRYERGWFLIPAKLANGAEVDLFRDARPLSWERPARPHAWISDNRWYKYYARLDSPRYPFAKRHLGPHLCRQWNRSHGANEQLEVLYVAYVSQEPLPSERVRPKNSRILVEQECRPGAAEQHRSWLDDMRRRLLGPQAGG